MTTNDTTTTQFDQLVQMFQRPWLSMRDRTLGLWLAAVSTDAAERIARKAGVGEDDGARPDADQGDATGTYPGGESRRLR
jgi:hypothetical protein